MMSESEGEIIESDIDKATTAQPSTNGISVNRRLREALSPSQSPIPQSPASSRQSRSRSPLERDRTPRGEKRRRNSEHRNDRPRTDPRQFRVHYEGRPPPEDDRRKRTGFKGLEYSNESQSSSHDRKGRHRYKNDRQRTRSRSPLSHNRGPDSRDFQRDRSNKAIPDSRSHGRRDRYDQDGSITKSFREQSVSERTETPPLAPAGKRGAQSSISASQNDTKMSNVSLGESDVSMTKLNISSASNDKDGPQGLQNEIVSIEERRKRREAIRAKHKGQATPLLVQALQQGNNPGSPSTKENTSATATPRSLSPAASSPRSPGLRSGPVSPSTFALPTDAELVNHAAAASPAPHGDSPSAADYDPIMDMKEDILRDQQRSHLETSHATHIGEGNIDERKLPHLSSTADPVVEKTVPKQKATDDMFASDDEDDAGGDRVNYITEPTHEAPLQAKKLDQSLLDDWDDPDGYYRFIAGELLDGRYSVQANLGKGMFSSVVRAVDSDTKTPVAIKIIRNNETMLKAGTKEMEILQKLAKADPDDKKHVIRLQRSFMHKGHLCMVFENLSINLREVLKKFGRDTGINLKAVRIYAQQMLLGLSLLRKCNIIHADLKPDNILVNEGRNLLKVCDLGSAADASESDITPYLVSRFYRAPEIILGVPYDFAIDMWSVGCTLFELYTGKILFTGRTNNQMLKSMMECRGKFSLKMLKKAEFGGDHFDEVTLDFKSFERDRVTGRDITKLINYIKPVKDLKTKLLATANASAASGSSNGRKDVLPDAETKEVLLFADLLDKCLALNPERRITPGEALKHPFITRDKVPVLYPVKR